MRLIDADKLEKTIEMAIKTNDMIAEAYGIQHEDFAKLQKGIMRNVLEIVKKQPTIKKDVVFPQDFYLDDVDVWRLKKEKVLELMGDEH